MRDVFPEGGNFGRGTAFRVHFHYRAAVDHRSGEVGTVVKRDRGNGAVLGERDCCFRGDLRLGRCSVDHEDQWLAGAFAKVDRCTDSAQIVRAGASRDDDQFGNRNHRLDGHGDCRRRIDHSELEALLSKDREVRSEPCNGGLCEGGKFRFTLVPPVCKRPLRIDIDKDDRASARSLGLNGQMSGERGFTRSALLRCQSQYTQG